MDSLQAQHAFWSGFEWPAYNESSVPDGAKLPYITYEPAVTFFKDQRPRQLSASLWTRSNTWTAAVAKATEISDAIGDGKYLRCDGGALYIQRGIPWMQTTGDAADGSIRRVVLAIEMESIIQ